jgi:citrate lyase alpha subunit
VTPGETVDFIVTERGYRSSRPGNLCARLKYSVLPVKDIRQLKAEIEHITGIPDEVRLLGRDRRHREIPRRDHHRPMKDQRMIATAASAALLSR